MKRTITTNAGKYFLLFLILFMGGFLPIVAQDNPVPQSGDVITFSGGAVDPGNPDIYTINMGVPELGANAPNKYYPITISRPKGTEANYPVSVFYEWNSGSMSTTAAIVATQEHHTGNTGDDSGVLTFAVGEMTKMLYVNFPVGGEMKGSKEAMYIFFSPLMRSKTQQSVLELVFTNPVEVNITTPQVIAGGNRSGPLVQNHGTGQYTLMKFEYLLDQNGAETQFTKITDDQKLAVTEYHVDHDNLPYGSPEMNNPNSLHQVMVSPRLANTTHTTVVFLHKITENAIVTDFQEGNEDKYPVVQYKPDFITGILPAGGVEEAVSLNLEDYEPDQYMVDHEKFNFFPRFGPVSTNKSSYDINEVVTLSIPFLNAKLYQKIYGNNWLNHIFFTLDGGGSFLANHPSYDAETGKLSVSFNAPGNTSKETTLYPEIGIRRYETDDMAFPQDGFTSIKVNKNTAPTVFTTSISMSGLPERDRIFIGKKPHTVLSHKVLPENCSFLNATWSSNNENVLEITSSGELIPKATGTAVITLTSDEVGYRTSNSLSAKNDVLIKTFTITVKNMPELQAKVESQRKLAHESIVAKFTQDIIASGWIPANKPSLVTITHADPQYAPITLTPNLSDKFDVSGEFEVEIPFDDRTFRRRNSAVSPQGNLFVPVCTVDISIPVVENGTQDELTLTASCPVYILPYVYPRIVGYSETNVVRTKDEMDHDIIKSKFTIENLDKQFTMELKISRVTCNDFTDQIVPNSLKDVYSTIFDYPIHGTPRWLKLDDRGESYYAEIEYSLFADAATVPVGMYYKYICDLYVRSHNIPGERGVATARSRVHVYNPNFDSTQGVNITYHMWGNGNSLPMDEENWKKDNSEELQAVKEQLDNMYLEDANSILHVFSMKSQIKVIDRLNYPEQWGPCVLKIYYSDGGELHRTIDVNRVRPIYLKFPKPGMDYRFTLSFPNIKAEKTFTYRWEAPDDLENIRQFQVYRYINLPANVKMSYKYKGEKREKTALAQGRRISLPVSMLSESDTIWLYPQQNFKNAYVVTRPNEFYRVEQTKFEAEMDYALHDINNKWLSVTWYAVNKRYTSVSLITETPTLKLHMLNEDGEAIQANGHVNFMINNGYNGFIQWGTAEFVDGFATIPLRSAVESNRDQYRIYVEFVADGYHPQVEEYNFYLGESGCRTANGNESEYMDGKYYHSLNQVNRAIMKKGDKMYSMLQLHQPSSKYPSVDMKDISVFSHTPYLPGVFNDKNVLTQAAVLEMTTTWNYENPPTLISNSEKATMFYPTVSVKYDKNHYKWFENTYIYLYCNLAKQEIADGELNDVNFSDPQHAASVYLCNGTQKVYQIPGLINMNPVPPEIKFAPPAVEKLETKDASKDTNLGDSKQNFDEFNISTLESLPFCIQVENKGNDWIVRGALEIDLFSTSVGTKTNKVSSTNFKEKFNEMKQRLKHDENYGKTTKKAGVDVSIAGYVEGKGTYNPDTGELENITFTAGGISIGAEASVSLKKSFTVGEFGVSLTGALKTRVDFFKSQNTTETFNVDIVFDNTISLTLKAWAQIGFDAWFVGAYLGVRGTAWASMTHRLERLATGAQRDGLKFNLGASIDLYARAWFLFIEYTWDKNLVKIEKDYLVPNDETNPFNNPIGTRSMTRSQLMSKSFMPANLSMAAPSLTTLVPNVYANSRPRYIGDNGFIFTNIGVPTDLNDDRIQVYKAKTMTSITPTATTAAYNFDVATAASKSVVVFEQQGETVSNEEMSNKDPYDILNELTPKTEVVAVINNGGGWNTTPLTTNNYANMSPKVAISADGNKAVAVWNSGKMVTNDIVNGNDRMTVQFLRGELLMSYYNGTNWSAPKAITYMDENFQLAESQLVLINDTLLMVAVNQSPNKAAIAEGEIVTLCMPVNSTASINSTKIKGRTPQIKRIKNENIITFLTEVPDTTGVYNPEKAGDLDIFLMAIDDEGIYKNGLSGYIGLEGRNIQGYQLVVDDNPVGVNSISVLWTEPAMILSNQQNEEYTIHDKLFAARLGRWNGQLFTSAPYEVLTAPADHWISSYDGQTKDTDLKAAVVIANQSSGAEIVEQSISFTNSIEIVAVSYLKEQLMPGANVPVNFMIENKGFAPTTQFEVTVGTTTTTVMHEIMPGEQDVITAYYSVPSTNAGMNYDIVPSFATENMTRAMMPADRYSGIRARTAIMTDPVLTITRAEGMTSTAIVDMGIIERSNTTGEETTSIILEVINSTPFALEDEKVKVGLYTDPTGKELYPGTSVKEIPVAELLDPEFDINTSTIAAFKVPTVREKTSVYAVVSTTDAAGNVIEDTETIDNYTIVTLYPNPNRVGITLAQLPDGKVGDSYTTTLEATGKGPFFWSIAEGKLPDGLSISTETGVIGGTPTKDGRFTFKVKSTNNNSTDIAEMSIVVNPSTGIGTTEEDATLKATAVKDGILVTGIEVGTSIAAYNAQGILLFWQSTAENAELLIPITEKGVYIVVNGTRRVKVIN
ncbi:hypothetical protein D0T50_06305 [Bacteroides sp. 214]|uniref:Ig domain-containing protein n=1 Tax=Bacteroides sp. 214 TaxID=2302935 RepID=UPI0013CFFE14|nr:Ig domain-containing protein [Bacteroides sp. 214]NDW12501.1 hypothetical protein [Bacteroides sp. 214]